MPTLSIFDLLREDDDAFIQRTGWSYQPTVSVYALGPVDPKVTEVITAKYLR